MATLTPFFHLPLTHWTPFLNSLLLSDPLFNNSQPIFDNLSPTVLKFLFKMCPNLYFSLKLTKVCLILTVWPPYLWSSHLPFWKTLFTKRPLLSSYCPSTPITSKLNAPPKKINKIKEGSFSMPLWYSTIVAFLSDLGNRLQMFS